ncbi:hypothetical protein DL766_010370 [Monosporascus sp. MC13-8B]|nr:hypothetical protein DL763_008696 [Monosporascus cannonballus]RYP02394.1 hypothetical protein DL766_010370 [Monosporascus sp. MC13-8B]
MAADDSDAAASPFSSDSSVPTSAHLTPDSDSDSGADTEGGEDRRGLPPGDKGDLGVHHLGITGDGVYELQDMRGTAYQEEGHSSGGGGGRRRISGSTVASLQLYTPDEEKAVIRKFDRRLVLFLSLCYMLAFLDRSNIGNARIAGMEEDLQTQPPRDEWYDWALTSFYLAYIGFEWMSLLWKIIPAHIYVAAIVASWGITASLQSVCTSYPVLIFLRTMLGIGEAAFTGVPFYLSFFFKRHELAFRTAIFISAAPLATTFASSLAWLILKVGEASPIAPWRLLFLLEGFPSVVVATIAWSVIPDSPDAAPYLTAREKKVARLRLRHEKPRRKGSSAAADAKAAGGLKSRDVLSVLVDPKAWIAAAMLFLANMAYSSLPVFLPTILNEMGYSALESQGLAAPPYLLAFVAVLATARLSDRARSRTPFVVAHALASAAGYGLLALAQPLGLGPGLRYAAVYPAATGFFSVVVIAIAWSVNNQASASRRGGGFALLQLVGQCGPLVGVRLYPRRHAPFYTPGMAACAVAMAAVALLALLLRFYLAHLNRRLDEDDEEKVAGADAGAEEAQGLSANYSLKLPSLYFMQQGPSETLENLQNRTDTHLTGFSIQHGCLHHNPSGSALDSLQRQERFGSLSPQSVRDPLAHGVDPDFLDERLRGLNVPAPSSTGRPAPRGQRISEYENALALSTPRKALGFTVVKRADAESGGFQLSDFPNEILTHILSHLHPDSHASVALVSKRFYSLVTTPHAWRMAFQRFFPGQDALAGTGRAKDGAREPDDTDAVRSETRYFTRLTPHASWRSEYLLRTRLLRSLARGKPGTNLGGVGSSPRNAQSSKKSSAVLTYNTKLPAMVTHLHATFAPSGKKAPRVLQGAADLCVASASDPTTGRVEKWGLDDPFAFAQPDEVVPQLLPYGVGEGPAVVPNVMDISQPYGVVGGEGFPGGRVFYRPSNEYRGKYLGQTNSVVEAHPDIPKIPELSEGICSVWITKSSAVPSLTQSMVGIMTGSSLGVVTTYALGYDPSGPRYANGEITARWVLSPGVPIVALQVDDNYSQKRKALGRLWAVALNALGEVYYLTQPPTPPATKSKADDSTKLAWHAGRSAYWQLVEATRRQARPDELDKNAVRGAYSPRSPSNGMNLKKEQLVAEAREIERFLRYKPSHFRKVCTGWDMRRRLEVDFAGDDEHGAGESIFVINCGIEEDQTSSILRYSRSVTQSSRQSEQSASPVESPLVTPVAPSIFGGSSPKPISPKPTGSSPPENAVSSSAMESPTLQNLAEPEMDDWTETSFCSKDVGHVQITTSSVDCSSLAIVARFEDPVTNAVTPSNVPATPTGQSSSDIPGRRARLFGVGTDTGKIVLWNMRAAHVSDGVQPVRIIRTESPQVSCLALSASYLVHGGSDGLVQAWDPLASTLEPVRTLNSRSPGRLPRHILTVNPALRNSNLSTVGAIHLDPGPTILRGIVAFGAFVRYWSYSSSGQATGRKRRLRHSDVHGRTTGRRHGGGVKGYIAAEAEELRAEEEIEARERTRLRARFGVGLADLTEEEALQYAEMISQEAFLLDEQRRTSASDTGSAADFDTTSTTSSADTITPDPSMTSFSPPVASSGPSVQATNEESDFELQIQAALRLSLLESADDAGQSAQGNSSGEFEFPIIYKEKQGKRPSSTPPSSSHSPMLQRAGSSSRAVVTDPDADDDLQFALKLSLAEEESRKASLAEFGPKDQFPPLESRVAGKGKRKAV